MKQLFLISIFFVTTVIADGNLQDWQVVSSEDGIHAYKKEVPGSPVVAFRGDAVIDTPLPKLIQILSDMRIRKDWAARVKEAKIVKVISKTEHIEYTRTGAPWPIKDRDFVYDVVAVPNDALKEIQINFKSIESNDLPELAGVVRGTIVSANYAVKAIENGKKSLLSVEIHADPKGALPKWVVNFYQKSWARKTIENIKRVAARKDIIDQPDALEWFNRVNAPVSAMPSVSPSPADSKKSKSKTKS